MSLNTTIGIALLIGVIALVTVLGYLDVDPAWNTVITLVVVLLAVSVVLYRRRNKSRS